MKSFIWGFITCLCLCILLALSYGERRPSYEDVDIAHEFGRLKGARSAQNMHRVGLLLKTNVIDEKTFESLQQSYRDWIGDRYTKTIWNEKDSNLTECEL